MKIIDIKNCNVYQTRKILEDFSLQVEDFEHTAIIGPNGSGKSTFIRLLMQELYPSRHEGENPEIKIMGRDDWSIFELRKAVSLVSLKFAEHLVDAAPLSVFDAVASSYLGTYGFFAGDNISAAQEQIVRDVMLSLHLDKMAKRSIKELSTGQLRKVLIARAMVLKPKLILLDEPTLGLDILAQHEFLKYLQEVVKHTTVLLVTHHLEEVIPAVKKTLLIKDGKIFRFGNKEDVLTKENLSQLFDADIELSISASGTYSMRLK